MDRWTEVWDMSMWWERHLRVPTLASSGRSMVALPPWPCTVSLTPVLLWTWILFQEPKDYVIAALVEINARVHSDMAVDCGVSNI